jgi:hypothetical protein
VNVWKKAAADVSALTPSGKLSWRVAQSAAEWTGMVAVEASSSATSAPIELPTTCAPEHGESLCGCGGDERWADSHVGGPFAAIHTETASAAMRERE